MEFGVEIYAIAVAAGLLAGVINTLAGSGSLVALAALIAIGLPAPVANGTNRVGVLIQSVVALKTMSAHGTKKPEGMGWILASATVGALGGAWLATGVDAEALEWIIIGVLWAMLLLVLLRPGDWLRKRSEEQKGKATVGKVLIFVLVGAWGGFLQAGVGILLLGALVLAAGKNVIEATAIKMVVVLVYTVGALAIFIAYDQVHWELGLVMGVGQGVGGWMGGRFAATSPRAPIWIRRLLIAVILLAAAELMGLLPWIRAWIGGFY